MLHPPLNAKTVSGEIQSVVLLEHPPSFARHYDVPTAARRAGVLYEKKVVELLFELLCPADRPGEVKMYAARWFKFVDKLGTHYCQPDVVIEFSARRAVAIFEVKAFHTESAWWQLNHLYLPVVKKYWPECSVQCVEVVKSFDPSVPWPEDPNPMFGLREFKHWLFDEGEASVASRVLQWKPNRKNREERDEWLRHL